jgi:hypothetical protein
MLLVSDQFIYVNLQTFSNLKQVFQRRLCAVGTPLRHRSGVFTQLLCQPFVGSLLFSQYHFESVQVFILHNESMFNLKLLANIMFLEQIQLFCGQNVCLKAKKMVF